ncbi:MAG TPA: 6-phosphofructokinase [Chitinophagaceae bacterium]|nr:6-phosphofructokinase [Chitinophagaceae bacterium]
MNQIQNIGIMTSGGDSSGMNAAIRAIVRTAIQHRIKPMGIMNGYQGMIDGHIVELKTTDVSNIIQRGGTILKTARSKEFMTAAGMEKAYQQLQKNNIQSLVLIGGDGTFKGAVEFFKQYQIPAIGLPGTIDNDLNGTDYTIGFDTAVNTAVWAIDKIRDTAASHDRLFLVEVMGRDAGYIALHSGIACGAEHIFIPEKNESIQTLIDTICDDQGRKKLTNIIVVAEGDEFGGALELSKIIQSKIPHIETRVTVLGHIQRGGAPSCFDRILASRLGFAAVQAIIQGRTQEMVGLVNNEIVYTPFTACVKLQKPISNDMLEMIHVLAR